MQIPTSPQTPQLRHARSLLYAMVCTLPNEDVLPAGEALATLDNVFPPLPPADEMPEGTVVSEADVLAALRDAAQVAADPQETARIVMAGESLTTPLVL